MSRLFLRIFLWSWLMAAAIVVAMVAGSPFLTRSHPNLDRWERRVEAMVRHAADDAAARVARGEQATGCRRHGRDGHAPCRVYVIGETGRDTLGRPVPEALDRLVREVRRTGEPRTERVGTLHASARTAVTPGGRTVVVVAAIRRPPRVVDLLAPRFLLPRLAVLLTIVGLLAFVLARRIAAPMATLRAAARRLADGDLEARVGPPLTRRRDEIGELARDFDAMAARLQALLESERRLLRDVSHELRSPLARIGVALELARRGDPAEREQALGRIGLEADRLNAMIGQILTLARLEDGGAPPVRQPVDLGTLVAAVVEDARFEARRRGVAIELRTETTDCVAEGDAGLLRSAVENVVRNALRHAAEDGRITVVLRPAGEDRAAVIVADDGPGVGEADLERLFEPFYRTGTARDRATGGVGLGLAITAAAVRAHGGAVAASNRPGGGLEVRIELPCRREG